MNLSDLLYKTDFTNIDILANLLQSLRSRK